jgi:HEAT repeat protein
MKKWLKLQSIILVSTALFALGFIVFLLIGLARFEGHKSSPSSTRIASAPLAESAGAEPRDMRPGPTTPEGIARVNLRHLLMRLQRTPQRSRRQKIIDKARLRIDDFEAPLVAILEDERDALLVPAIRLAVGLEIGHISHRLVLLADVDSAPVQIAALEAKEVLDPWTATELAHILGQVNEPGVLTVALRFLAGKDEKHRPVAQLIDFLRSDVAAVRNSAAKAMPGSISDAHMDALCALATAEKVEPEFQRAAARALGQTTVDERVETCLMSLLNHEDWLVRRTSLESLSKKSSKLQNVEPILRVIRDEKRRFRERAFALMALERTGTVPCEQIESMLPELPPVLRMFACRSLLAAGDSSAIPALIDILDTEKADSAGHDDFICATSESRAILTLLAREDLGPSSGPWKKWLEARADVKPTATRRAPPTFW